MQVPAEKNGQPTPAALAGQPVILPEHWKVRFIAVSANSAELAPGDYTVFAGVPSANGMAELQGKFALVVR